MFPFFISSLSAVCDLLQAIRYCLCNRDQTYGGSGGELPEIGITKGAGGGGVGHIGHIGSFQVVRLAPRGEGEQRIVPPTYHISTNPQGQPHYLAGFFQILSGEMEEGRPPRYLIRRVLGMTPPNKTQRDTMRTVRTEKTQSLVGRRGQGLTVPYHPRICFEFVRVHMKAIGCINSGRALG